MSYLLFRDEKPVFSENRILSAKQIPPSTGGYVTMVDKFASRSRNVKDILIFVVKDYHEMEIVMKNAKNRTDMRYINWRKKKPSYTWAKVNAHVYTPETGGYKAWYTPGYF